MFYPELGPPPRCATNSAGQSGSGGLRNILVVLQFAVSIGLGIAASVVFSQINYARNIDLGFRHDHILILGGGRLNAEQRQTFVQTLRANPGITDVGMSNFVPFTEGQSLSLIKVPGQSDAVTLNGIAINPDYPKVYGIKLVAGRLLSETRGEDRINSVAPGGDPLNEGRNILVNATGARRLGFSPQEAVGKTVIFNNSHVKIVGSLADAKVTGAREPIKPTVYAYVPRYPMAFAIHIRPDMIPQTVDSIASHLAGFLAHGRDPAQLPGRYFR